MEGKTIENILINLDMKILLFVTGDNHNLFDGMTLMETDLTQLSFRELLKSLKFSKGRQKPIWFRLGLALCSKVEN
jgi:hypothetical protein